MCVSARARGWEGGLREEAAEMEKMRQTDRKTEEVQEWL